MNINSNNDQYIKLVFSTTGVDAEAAQTQKYKKRSSYIRVRAWVPENVVAPGNTTTAELANISAPTSGGPHWVSSPTHHQQATSTTHIIVNIYLLGVTLTLTHHVVTILRMTLIFLRLRTPLPAPLSLIFAHIVRKRDFYAIKWFLNRPQEEI